MNPRRRRFNRKDRKAKKAIRLLKPAGAHPYKERRFVCCHEVWATAERFSRPLIMRRVSRISYIFERLHLSSKTVNALWKKMVAI